MSGYTLAQKAKAVAAAVATVAGWLAGVAFKEGWEVAGVNVAWALGIVITICGYVAAFKIPNAPTGEPSLPPQTVEGTH